MRALHPDEPADAAALRVGEKNGVARLFENGSERVGVYFRVIRRPVGRHLLEELIERSLVLGELGAVVEGRPEAHAELPEPEVFVGRRITSPNSAGAQAGAGQGTSSTSSPCRRSRGGFATSASESSRSQIPLLFRPNPTSRAT